MPTEPEKKPVLESVGNKITLEQNVNFAMALFALMKQEGFIEKKIPFNKFVDWNTKGTESLYVDANDKEVTIKIITDEEFEAVMEAQSASRN